MNAENIQQEHIYNERIQEFFPLFDKTKKENDPIYNARVGFNTVKFLIERPNWNEDENKNKAYEFILQECDKIKKARKELEREVQKRLKDYIEGGVKEDGVKIYGNHASITLEDNKKEFKISEFLNSDFCQKNGISGFSTLHSDGKSGMHGFVAEEEGRKIRHYVVTDGSYEITLNWYMNGEKCTIKINIDKDGVDLIERNGVTDAQLQANKDVKIGGLFLYQIQFREKGKKQANEMQKDSQSFETTTRINVSRDVGVQATHMNRGVGSRTIISRSDSESDLGYESQEESSQNKRTPPPPLPRTSSLPPKGNVVSEQTSAEPAIHNQDNRQKDERYDSPTFTTFGYTASGEKETVAEEALQVKSATLAPPTQDVALKKVAGAFKSEGAKKSGNTGDKPPLQDDVASILAKRAEAEFLYSEDFDNEINSQEAKEKRERRQAARKESSEGRVYNLQSLFEGSSQNKKTPPPVTPRTNSLEKNVFDEQGENSSTKSVNQGQNKLSSNATDMAQKQFIENVLEKIEKGSQYNPIRNWLKDKIEGKENNQNLDVLEEKLSQKSGQGNVIEKRESDDSKPLPPTSTGENKYVGDTQLQKGSYRSGQEPEEEESNFQKTKEALEEWKKKRLNNYRKIDEDIKKVSFDTQEKTQSHHTNDLTPFEELKQRLSQKSYGLKQVNPKARYISSQTRKHLTEAGLLKDGLADIKTVVAPESRNDEFKETLNRELEAEEKIEISSNKVCNEPGGQPIDSADQVMNELREALEKPGRGLKRLARQIARTPVTNSKNPFLEQIKHDKPIHRWLEKKLAERENADKNQRHR
ncbi:hypothetical protein [Wolbachia pipientis]|uniref:hypothetical protein n=1 Tax=Wolbachia pipientis TaxID=955 RepID=UPI00202F7359|nr:hypothetical protein [Wolbachia pipientis]MCM1001684.1 hypothetical protein [Wolbachia pipientis]